MYIYLIHAERPLNGSQHYCGSAGNLERRIKRHRASIGSAMTRAWNNAGIQWKVVRTWQVPNRVLEHELKRQHNLARYCPVCNDVPLEVQIPPETIWKLGIP